MNKYEVGYIYSRKFKDISNKLDYLSSNIDRTKNKSISNWRGESGTDYVKLFNDMKTKINDLSLHMNVLAKNLKTTTKEVEIKSKK